MSQRHKSVGQEHRPYEPTLRDIRRACERIQAGWSERERDKRAGRLRAVTWMPPSVDWNALTRIKGPCSRWVAIRSVRRGSGIREFWTREIEGVRPRHCLHTVTRPERIVHYDEPCSVTSLLDASGIGVRFTMRQSMAFWPRWFSSRLIAENGLQPKKPRRAESGDGCAACTSA